MTQKQKTTILNKKTLCEDCLKNGKHIKSTEVNDAGNALCKFHYDRYIDNAFADIYYG